MEFISRRLPTGTYCGGHHPEQIEYRFVLVDGEETPHGQSEPRCFRDGCPDNVAAMAREERAGRAKL